MLGVPATVGVTTSLLAEISIQSRWSTSRSRIACLFTGSSICSLLVIDRGSRRGVAVKTCFFHLCDYFFIALAPFDSIESLTKIVKGQRNDLRSVVGDLVIPCRRSRC